MLRGSRPVSTQSSGSVYARLCAHAESKWSIIVAFFWGLCEATAFFIVPDVYLGFLALLNWRRATGAVIAVVAGAIVGGAVMYSVAVNDPRATNVFLARIPLISAEMVSATGARMRSEGLISMIDGPLRGIPYKIYAAQAGEQGSPFPAFLMITVLARLERLLPVVLIAGVVGKAFRELVEKRTPFVLGAYAIVWCVIYFLYYLGVR